MIKIPKLHHGQTICNLCDSVVNDQCILAGISLPSEPSHLSNLEPMRLRSTGISEHTTASNYGKNMAIFGILGAILVGFFLMEVLTFFRDESILMKARLSCIKERISSVTKTQAQGFLYNIFVLLSYIRKKGMLHTTLYEVKQTTSGTTQTEPETTESGRHLSGISSSQEDAKLIECYNSYSGLVSKHGEETAQKMSNVLLKSSTIITRAAQAYIDDELIREPITLWAILKHFHFYVSLLAKYELNSPRSAKLLIGLTAILGELFMTGLFYYSIDRTGILEILSYGLGAALIAIFTKIIMSIFLVRKYMTDDMNEAEMESYEASYTKCRAVGIFIGTVWIVGCVIGTGMLALNLSSIENWIMAFGAAALLELIVFPMLKIMFIIVVGPRLARMIRDKTRLSNSKAFTSMMDFGINYF